MGRTYFKLAHTRDPDRGMGEWNGANFSDPEIDKLLQSTADIVDPKERGEVLKKLKIIIANAKNELNKSKTE